VPNSEIDLQLFGEKIENAVRLKWRNIAKSSLKEEPPIGFWDQVENHLEIFWVIEPDVTDYKRAIEKLEYQLAGIKNIRSFKQFDYNNSDIGERGRKCNLDGYRNVKFFRSEGKHYAMNETVQVIEGNALYPNSLIQNGEGLSAVSFVKRSYGWKSDEEFKSTAEIALLDALNFLNNDKRH
jgi:hypothetical protein